MRTAAAGADDPWRVEQAEHTRRLQHTRRPAKRQDADLLRPPMDRAGAGAEQDDRLGPR